MIAPNHSNFVWENKWFNERGSVVGGVFSHFSYVLVLCTMYQTNQILLLIPISLKLLSYKIKAILKKNRLAHNILVIRVD